MTALAVPEVLLLSVLAFCYVIYRYRGRVVDPLEAIPKATFMKMVDFRNMKLRSLGSLCLDARASSKTSGINMIRLGKNDVFTWDFDYVDYIRAHPGMLTLSSSDWCPFFR